MDSIVILMLTMGMLLYFFQKLWSSREYLSKYLSTVGGKKATVSRPKPIIWIPLFIIHLLIGLFVGYIIFMKESDGRIVFRLLQAIIVALIFLLLLFIFYFIVVVIIKELISMNDKTINFILIYSFLSDGILFQEIITKGIEYPKGFLWSSLVLYMVNIYCIGRIIWSIFKKKVLVKSIWSIAIMNISFVILSLANITYEIQHVYPTACYSRTLTSWGDALYFVVISFFTVGYGDLYPTCEVTKILSMTVILSGFTFTAVFVSAALSTTIEHFSNMNKN
jgi:Ion channel.